MKYSANVLCLLLVLIISCEQVTDIDLPEHEPQIVLSSYYYAGEQAIYARTTTSVAINDDLGAGSTISLFLYDENNELMQQLENGSLYRFPLSQPLQAGNTYKIISENDYFPTISATQIMPYPPVATLDQFTNGSNIIIGGKQQDIYKITLSDEADTDNYYEFKISTLRKDTTNAQWKARNLRSPYPQVETGRKTLYLKDNSFSGEAHQVELFSNTRDTSKFQIKVQVNSITRDKYLFAKTLLAYQDAEGNPFAEPVIVHTNVENGQGIFSMENKTEFLIE